jgi:hypothetical protein
MVTANGQQAKRKTVKIGVHSVAHKTIEAHSATQFGTFSGQMESGVPNE